MLMLVFWMWFVFMMAQVLYVTFTMSKQNHLTWTKLGWFLIGFIDAFVLGMISAG